MFSFYEMQNKKVRSSGKKFKNIYIVNIKKKWNACYSAQLFFFCFIRQINNYRIFIEEIHEGIKNGINIYF